MSDQTMYEISVIEHLATAREFIAGLERSLKALKDQDSRHGLQHQRLLENHRAVELVWSNALEKIHTAKWMSAAPKRGE